MCGGVKSTVRDVGFAELDFARHNERSQKHREVIFVDRIVRIPG